MKKPRSKQRKKAERVAQAEDKRVLAKNAEFIRGVGEHARKRSIEDIIAVGERLTDSKPRVPRGKWPAWLKEEFGWSERTALNLMRVYELAISEEYKSVNFTDLSIAVSALYALARSSTPKEVRAKIIGRAKAGEHISASDGEEAVHPPPTETSEVDGHESLSVVAEQPTTTETSEEADGHESLSVVTEESEREEVTGTEDDAAREPDYRAKVRDTRGWAAEITVLARKCIRYRNLAAKHMDRAVLREVVDDQMFAGWCEGYENFGMLLDKVKSVRASQPTPSSEATSDATAASDPTTETPSISPAEVVNEATLDEATSDEAASSATAPENATSDITT